MAPPVKRRKTSSKVAVATASTETTTSADHTTTSTEPTPSKSTLNAYPGFDPWNATLDVHSGDNTMSTFDSTKAQFTHTAKIYDSDAFKLKPLTIASGPLKGRRVIMLEPINDFFRFMDLPPEIRNMVYDLLFQESEDIGIERFRSKYASQRPVRRGYQWQSAHKDMTWNAAKAEWEGQTPSAYSLLRVSKQIKTEAAAVAYGSNRFVFDGLPEVKLLLDSIGSMRQFLRHIKIRYAAYHRTIATPAFHKLKDAKNLQSLTFPHGMICEERKKERYAHKPVATQELILTLKPLMKALQRAQKSSENPVSVPDIMCVGPNEWPSICDKGRKGDTCSCSSRYGTQSACCERLRHVKEVEVNFRKLLADAMGIEGAPAN